MKRIWAVLALLLTLAVSAAPADAGPKFKVRGRGAAAGAAASWCSDAAIVSPVQGTSLASVCALTAPGATGPRYSPTNGTWVNAATSLAAGTYLGDLGCVASIPYDTIVWCSVADGGSITIEKYNFGSTLLSFYGNNITVTVRDCTFDDPGNVGGGIKTNIDRSLNEQHSQNVTLNLEHNDFNGGPSSGMIAFTSAGTLNESYDRIRNQPQVIWYVSNAYTNPIHINFTDNYITGGGVNTACCSHLEAIQFQEGHAGGGIGSTFNFSRNVVNPIDGQPMGGASWTAWIVADDAAVTYTDNIFHNWDVVAANPTYPGKTGPVLSYSLSAVFTNNALQPGSPGSGGGYVCSGCASPTDGGGNRRTDTNTAINF